MKVFFQLIFKKPFYVILAIVTALLFFLSSVWLANYGFLSYVFNAGIFNISEKIRIAFDFSELIKINFNFQSLTIVIVLSVLSGVNISALVFYIKNKIAAGREAGLGGLGLAMGILGVGCLSCGSVILSFLFGTTTTLMFISNLPLKGIEFGLVAIVLLLLSIYLVAKKINNLNICDN